MDLSGSPTVGELLERVKRQALGAQQHQDIPFEQVVETGAAGAESGAQSGVSGDVCLAERSGRASSNCPGWRWAAAGAAHVVAKFDLTLSLQEAGERIVGGVEYATALFERATMERYLGYFRRLLEGMVADESRWWSRVPLLSERRARSGSE